VAQRKRVLFLINSLAGGGAERVMCTLLRHSELERNEFDIVLGLIDNEKAGNVAPDWVDVRQLDGRKAFTRSMLEVRKLFGQVQPDVTMSFLTRANFANVLNARCPCIISERANTSAHFGNDAKGAISRAMVRTLYPRATKVIGVSEGVADDLRVAFGVPTEKLVTIANPVDGDVIRARGAEIAAVEVEAPYIMAAGRLVPSKGFDMLIRAYAAAKVGPKLVIAGEGFMRDELIKLARECGAADRVVFPGFVANPYPLMRGAELFVLSSSSEGFPNALVEAMTLGVPVIATNSASGPSEILAEAPRASIADLTFAAHGVLTPVGSVERMTEALRAMQDPERRRTYSDKGVTRVTAFSAAAAKDRYWNVIREALQLGRQRR
jgi:N-acetylgalactosamine-N,N'-diacetylbacillosaminyl-diphospho-undecaprenol 4-alpha-N-acetylgalactosaminyltransferase